MLLKVPLLCDSDPEMVLLSGVKHQDSQNSFLAFLNAPSSVLDHFEVRLMLVTNLYSLFSRLTQYRTTNHLLLLSCTCLTFNVIFSLFFITVFLLHFALFQFLFQYSIYTFIQFISLFFLYFLPFLFFSLISLSIRTILLLPPPHPP